MNYCKVLFTKTLFIIMLLGICCNGYSQNLKQTVTPTQEEMPGEYLRKSANYQISSIWIAGSCSAIGLPMVCCSNKKDLRIIGGTVTGVGLAVGLIYQILAVNAKNKSGQLLDIQLNAMKAKLNLADSGLGVKMKF